MKGRGKVLIYCEGKTECTLLRALNITGKCQEMNLWERDVTKVRRHWGTASVGIFVIYDTDVTRTLDRFIQNLEIMHSGNVLSGLLQQHRNLEEELVASCAGLRTTKDLYDLFDCQSASEFKSRFCATTNPAAKLAQVGFNPELLWRQALLPEMPEKFRRFAAHYHHLPKR